MKGRTWHDGFADGIMAAAQFLINAHGEDGMAEELLLSSIKKDDALRALKRSGDFEGNKIREALNPSN